MDAGAERAGAAGETRFGDMPPADPRAFKSLGWRARLVRLWLVGMMFGCGLDVLLAINYHSQLKPGTMVGKEFADVDVFDASRLLALADLILLIALLFCSVLWIVWFHRAYKNLESFGLGLRFGTGWAIGGWFVPILSLWRPKQIANDIWRGSSSQAADDYTRWEEQQVSPLVHWWWALFILSGIVGRLSAEAGGNLAQERSMAVLTAVSDVVLIVTAVLALAVVQRVTRMQAEKARAPELATA
jgi:eukaryotic-like serine/threonine-protein kinase